MYKYYYYRTHAAHRAVGRRAIGRVSGRIGKCSGSREVRQNYCFIIVRRMQVHQDKNNYTNMLVKNSAEKMSLLSVDTFKIYGTYLLFVNSSIIYCEFWSYWWLVKWFFFFFQIGIVLWKKKCWEKTFFICCRYDVPNPDCARYTVRVQWLCAIVFLKR